MSKVLTLDPMAVFLRTALRSLYFGYCPHPVAVYIRGPIKGYIEPYYAYYPTVTEVGAVPNLYSRKKILGYMELCGA